MLADMVEIRLFDIPAICVARVRRRVRRCRKPDTNRYEQLTIPFGDVIGKRNKSVIAPGRWFPIGPLIDRYGSNMWVEDRCHVRREFAAAIGMTQRNLRRRIAFGFIDGDTADEWATACDMEPARIWPDWYDDIGEWSETDCDICGRDMTGNPWCCVEQDALPLALS